MFEATKDVSQQSRQRLDKISHYFISDSPIKKTKRRIPLFLPVLIDGACYEKIVFMLNNELIKKGFSSCIINANDIDRELTRNGYLSSNEYFSNSSAKMDNQENRMNAYNLVKNKITDIKTKDIYLLPYTYEQFFIPVLFKKSALIIVPTLDEIRTAYGNIKILHSHSVNSIDVIMAYSNHIDTAAQYFTKLSEGVKYFLGLDIHENGYFLTDEHKNNTREHLNKPNNGIDKIAASFIDLYFQANDN